MANVDDILFDRFITIDKKHYNIDKNHPEKLIEVEDVYDREEGIFMKNILTIDYLVSIAFIDEDTTFYKFLRKDANDVSLDDITIIYDNNDIPNISYNNLTNIKTEYENTIVDNKIVSIRGTLLEQDEYGDFNIIVGSNSSCFDHLNRLLSYSENKYNESYNYDHKNVIKNIYKDSCIKEYIDSNGIVRYRINYIDNGIIKQDRFDKYSKLIHSYIKNRKTNRVQILDYEKLSKSKD